MTDLDDRPFRRLLRWYPVWWRRRHGDVVLSTLLDAAEADGRRTPTAAEGRHAALHGTAARIGPGFALAASLTAVAAAVVVGILWAIGSTGDLTLILQAGVIPTLTTAAIVATARLRGLTSDGEALAILATASAAWALNVLAALAWSRAFDAGDDGRPAVGLAAAWMPLVAAAGAVGAVALGLAMTALLRRATRRSFGIRIAIGIAAGCVLAPLVGVTTLSPAAATLMAGGAVVAALSLWRSSTNREGLVVSVPDAGAVASVPRPPLAPDPRRRAASRGLAWLATTGGSVGVAYALTGAMWSPGAEDGTAAMAHGITLLMLSVLPLLSSFGLSRPQAPTRAGGRQRWGPLLLVASGVFSVALAYVDAPDAEAMQPGSYAGAVLFGGALAWAMASRGRRPRAVAVTASVALGALFASFLGVMLAPVLVFGVPIAGALLALRTGPPQASPVAVSPGAPAPVL